GHMLLHAPQLAGSYCNPASQPSPIMPLQSAKPALHLVKPHWPFRHWGCAFGKLHAMPHLPQLVASMAVLISQPLATIMSQSATLALEAPRPHIELLQAELALASIGHGEPHIPQLFTSVVVSTSHPSPRLLLQSAKLVLQVAPHIEFAQVGVVFAGVGHA